MQVLGDVLGALASMGILIVVWLIINGATAYAIYRIGKWLVRR